MGEEQRRIVLGNESVWPQNLILGVLLADVAAVGVRGASYLWESEQIVEHAERMLVRQRDAQNRRKCPNAPHYDRRPYNLGKE